MERLPKFDETFNHIFEVLSDQSEVYYKNIRTKVKEEFYSDLSSELLAQKTTTGANTLLDRIGWAISYLTMGGYLKRTKRGYYKITDKGLQALENKQPLKLKELKEQPEYKEYQSIQKPNNSKAPRKDSEELEEETPSDLIDKGIEKINEEVKSQLWEKIKTMNSYNFESLILRLFKAMGYGDTIGTPKSKDGGIDGIINLDKLGLEKIYIQIKRFSERAIGELEIRNFIGAMSGDTNKGIFVTTSTFQDKAKEKTSSAHHTIKLIDGSELVDLMFEYGIGLQTKTSIEIKEIDDDFFDNFDN